MGTAPILLAWGDDLLLIEEAVAALGARMAAEDAMGGGLPEKVRLKAEGRGSGDGAEVLNCVAVLARAASSAAAH